MPTLRRYPAAGRPVFVTSVTYRRQPLLIENVDLLWNAVDTIRMRTHCQLLAWVALPDHFHLLVDSEDLPFSSIIQRIKMSFGASWRQRAGVASGRAWQHRFWDHIIRDQSDLNKHMDYIHYNPVRHGLVESPFDWSHSSIHFYRAQGIYLPDWGCDHTWHDDPEFGE